MSCGSGNSGRVGSDLDIVRSPSQGLTGLTLSYVSPERRRRFAYWELAGDQP